MVNFEPGQKKRPDRTRKGAWAIGAIAASVTDGAFERHGLARAEIVHSWPHLVGPDLARHCRPERVVPSKTGRRGGNTGGGGTLHVIASPAHVLDIHYSAERIIAAVNGLYGEQVISRIQVKPETGSGHNPDNRPANRPRPAAAKPQDLDRYSQIQTPDLRHALARLEAGILADEPPDPSPPPSGPDQPRKAPDG